uniref:PHD-type domain-containing protein n=1 Tax=Anas platyrhynchos platyrhynchos TaxID=8840 RepID=A0A493TIV6_ANAPP
GWEKLDDKDGCECCLGRSAQWVELTQAILSPLLQNEIHHDEHCTACKRGVNLQPCGTCPRAYHLNCLDPPLKTAPKGVWKFIDTVFREKSLLSQYQLHKICRRHKMHHGEVYPSNLCQ